MVKIEIENNQKDGKYAGTSRPVNFPAWLDHVKGRPDPPAFGDYELFKTDLDIDQSIAFKVLCGFAMQHVPVAFRTKDLNLHSGYAWLRGEMQGGNPEKVACLNYLNTAGMQVDALKDSKVKVLKEMVRQLHILKSDLPLIGIELDSEDA